MTHVAIREIYENLHLVKITRYMVPESFMNCTGVSLASLNAYEWKCFLYMYN